MLVFLRSKIALLSWAVSYIKLALVKQQFSALYIPLWKALSSVNEKKNKFGHGYIFQKLSTRIVSFLGLVFHTWLLLTLPRSNFCAETNLTEVYSLQSSQQRPSTFSILMWIIFSYKRIKIWHGFNLSCLQKGRLFSLLLSSQFSVVLPFEIFVAIFCISAM